MGYNLFMEKSNIKLNWPLIGNSHIIEYLAKSIANNKVAGSYIFTGPDNLGKTTVANFFASSLICTAKDKKDAPCGQCLPCQQAAKGIHGDIHLIKKDKEKKNISIEQVRDFIRTLGLSSFLNSYKIGIIKHAEDLSLEAVNALLKTLEEPKIKVVIILITTAAESLPATIVSRSQILKFYPLPVDIIYDYLIKHHQASRSLAKNISRLCLGRPALAVKFLEDKEFYERYKERVGVFLNFFTDDINNRLLALEELVGRETRGQESIRLGLKLIEIWQGLARDLVLQFFGQDDLIQHYAFAKELERARDKIDIIGLLKLFSLLKQAREFIKANVNPKLALEQVAINI